MTVQKGDVIFEIADLDNWELVLDVPQEEVGWVLRGLAEQAEPAGATGDGSSMTAESVESAEGLTVEFYLVAYPKHRLQAKVMRAEQVGQMGQVKEDGNVFEIRVAIPRDELRPIMNGLRAGSIGRAKVDTSVRPLGYVLLRKVVRFFRVTFF